MISWARKGVRVAKASVNMVRTIYCNRLTPNGMVVTRASSCLLGKKIVLRSTRMARAESFKIAVSASSSFLVSARCTTVILASIILSSLEVRSFIISSISFFLVTSSYGGFVAKLLLAICF